MLHEQASTVLIIDDDRDMRVYCARALQSEGYVTLTSDNGSAALQLLHERRIDLLVTDFHLAPPALRLVGEPRRAPVLNGIGLIQRALSSCPPLRIVFISADTQQLLATKGIDVRKIPLLRKPFHADALRQVVRSSLSKVTPNLAEGPPPSLFLSRAHPRFYVHHKAIFSGDAEGEGRVTNLSVGGCQIQSACAVEPNAWLTLVVTLPDGLVPVKINVGLVRWAMSGALVWNFHIWSR
ncbi:MAG: response regulator [Nitrospirota bacterium]|nr:response regulator [Nitrospirota bacterium]